MTELDELAAYTTTRAVAPSRLTTRAVPSYLGITVGASLIASAGFGGMVVGAALVVVGVVIAAQARNSSAPALVAFAGSTQVLGGLIALGAGMVLALVGQLALAVRDLARNSFRR